MSTQTEYPLPQSEELNISAFIRIFDYATNSYKFLFFLSLIQLLESNHFSQDSLQLKDILIGMLSTAWYPHSIFRLSFGSQDMIARELDAMAFTNNESLIGISRSELHNIRSLIASSTLSQETTNLLRYVPYRLIRPFFSDLMRGVRDHLVNQRIKQLCEQEFEHRKPLYKFSQNDDSIFLHPLWIEYLRLNFLVIQGWVNWKFLQYMQSKNPSTPAIASKIFPPLERESMSQQTKFWKVVIANSQTVRCIYSNQIIQPDFSLDHYLPWTFVAHNQLWNLIPVPKSVNSSKSNKIPSDIYFDKLIEVQHLGLKIANKNIDGSRWAEPYIVDLGFSNKSELMNFEYFKRQYSLKVKPLIALAISQGFESEWIYDFNQMNTN